MHLGVSPGIDEGKFHGSLFSHVEWHMYITFMYIYIHMGNNFDIGMPIKFSIISQRLYSCAI